MTDQTVGLPSRTPRLSRLRSFATRLLRRIELRPRAAWAVAALIAAGLMRHFWLDEGTFPNILFTAGVTLSLVALVVLLTRRVLFATALMASLIAVLVAAASIKRALMNMVLHAYDLFFYLSSWATVSYLWSDHRRYLLGLAGALLAATCVAWLAYRVDTPASSENSVSQEAPP